jgi:SOS-response transcriptional repressor LexA
VKGLTDRQRAILDWIVEFMREHRLPPTLREIGRAFGISSPGVLGHLRALERKGYGAGNWAHARSRSPASPGRAPTTRSSSRASVA